MFLEEDMNMGTDGSDATNDDGATQATNDQAATETAEVSTPQDASAGEGSDEPTPDDSANPEAGM